MIREAADIVARKLSLKHGDSSIATAFSHHAHLARIVASNNIARAHFLIAHNPNDALLLQVIDNNVTLRDPAEFSQKYDALQTLRANRSSRAEENRPSREPRAFRPFANMHGVGPPLEGS